MNNNQSVDLEVDDEVTAQLENLIEQAEMVNQEIDANALIAEQDLEAITQRVEQSSQTIDEMCAELDELEQETSEELDRITLIEDQDLTEN